MVAFSVTGYLTGQGERYFSFSATGPRSGRERSEQTTGLVFLFLHVLSSTSFAVDLK
jgi:hypothetical protein